MRVFSLLCLVVALYCASCTTQRAVTNNYLQNVSDTSGKNLLALTSPVIRKNDLLSIKVYSRALGAEPAVDLPYNLPDAGSTPGAGFLVDPNGNIEYPQIGLLRVEGLTRDELAEIVRKKFAASLDQPAVIVRFLNYRVTVLGEVRGPSTFTVPIEQITILEALGMAGDITEFGRKDNVKIFRQKDSDLEIGTIDLTSGSMFNSPYFRLQQNDVIMVEQTRKKVQQQDQQALVQQIGIATSIITALALILNIIR